MANWYENDRVVNVLDPEEIENSVPEEIKSQAKRVRDAYYYNRQFGVPVDQAFDLQPQLNRLVFGQDQLSASPGRLFVDAFKQSLSDKPAMMLRGITVYTSGKAFGVDPLLDKASLYLESLKNPKVMKQVRSAAQGKVWPVGEERRWWQVERKYLPEVINTWAANVGDQIPLMLLTKTGQMAGKVVGVPLSLAAGAAAIMVTGGPDPSDVVTAPAVVAITQEVTKHLGGAAPLVAIEAAGFLDEADNLEIDPDIAEKHARLYGLGAGAIEYSQWLFVLGRYSKISQRAQKGILVEVLKYIGGTAFEGLEEITQGGLQNYLLQKAVAEMKERHPDYKGEAPTTWEDAKRDGIIGAGVAAITGMPGTGMTVAQGARTRMAQVNPKSKKLLGEPSVVEMEKEAAREATVPGEGAAPVAAGAPEVAGAARAAEVSGAEAAAAAPVVETPAEEAAGPVIPTDLPPVVIDAARRASRRATVEPGIWHDKGLPFKMQITFIDPATGKRYEVDMTPFHLEAGLEEIGPGRWRLARGAPAAPAAAAPVAETPGRSPMQGYFDVLLEEQRVMNERDELQKKMLAEDRFSKDDPEFIAARQKVFDAHARTMAAEKAMQESYGKSGGKAQAKLDVDRIAKDLDTTSAEKSKLDRKLSEKAYEEMAFGYEAVPETTRAPAVAPEIGQPATPTQEGGQPVTPPAGPALPEAERPETVEEARASEAKLELEASEELEPSLYIGNVTARMKGVMAEALTEAAGKEVVPEEIGPFKEGPWPTKRTKIKLTRGQAEEYLAWLEADLQRRLDKNLINTHEDMAIANADWGDMKSLRKALGLPEIQRPWKIVYEQGRGQVVRDQGEIATAKKEVARLQKEFDKSKTEAEADEILAQIDAKQLEIDRLQRAAGKAVKVIKDTSSAIWGAVQPSSLQESKMTVQEVLRAVMKRGARFAKMAHAAGRRELRAAIRLKARAKARMNKAIRTIKQTIPRTVDIVYREAIDAIRNDIDPFFRSEKALGKREGLREFLARNPDKAKDIPDKLFSRLRKKPLNDYTIEELEAVASEIERLKDLGGLRRKLEVLQYERGKQKDLEKIAAASLPIDERDMIRPDKIGDKLSLTDRLKNRLGRMLSIAGRKWRSVATPMDVLFDMLDGTKGYKGPNYRIFKEALDGRWSNYLDLRDELWGAVPKAARELGLKEGNFERIGVYAAVQQEGGRQKLLDTGYTDAQIDAVVLTKEEMQIYEMMRTVLDDLAPSIEDVMHNVYNEPLGKVKNYFSFMTDFEAMTDYEIREMYGDRPVELSGDLRKNVERGFTKTRTGGKQIIKINAMEVFLQHVDNAAYLIEMGPEIKRLGEIAATEEYGKAVGAVGQEEVRSWLDLMARKGRVQRNKTIPILDVFRKHSGAAVIGFKLSSALVNITPLLDGGGLIGTYAFRGASDIATSRDWRDFIMRNFPELRDRVGGDIEFLEFGHTGIQNLERMGFWLLQRIDGVAASSVASGAYQKYLNDHGLKMDFENPNQDAITYAQRIIRRTQSSVFYKDLPSGLTRGGFTGNKSVDRLLFQFQSFILNRWSLIEHDMIRSGIRSRSVAQAMNIFLWLSLAGFAEIGIRRLSKEFIAMLTGDDLEDWSETFAKEVVVNTLQNIPFVSQGAALYNYGQIPVPSLSLAQDIAEKIEILKRTKDPDKRKLKMLELLVLSTGTVTGVPGTMQTSEVIRSMERAQREKEPHF